MTDQRPSRVARTAVLVAVAVATYFGVAYWFSFSRATGSSRAGIHLAVLMMDAVLVAHIVVKRRLLFRFHLAQLARGRPERIFQLISVLALSCVVLAHVDYLHARYRGAEDGLAGPILSLKIYLLAAQLLYLLFFELSQPRLTLPGQHPAHSRAWYTELLLFSIVFIPLGNYLAHNAELFSAFRAVEYLAFFGLCALGGFVVLRQFQRALDAAPIAAPLAAGLAFVYYSMPLVSSMFARPVEALFRVQVVLAVGLPSVLSFLYFRKPAQTSRAAVVIALCSIAGSGIQAGAAGTGSDWAGVASNGNGDSGRESTLREVLAGAPVHKPDVYLLVFDGYAAPAMMKAYGMQNESTPRYLQEHGFTVYPDAYSLFLATKPSMAGVLNMAAKGFADIRAETLATGFFKSHGYRTHLVLNSYLLEGTAPIAAESVFPPAGQVSPLRTLYRGIAGGEFKSKLVFQDVPYADWVAAKRSVLSHPNEVPTMLYAHSGFPGHSQNSGACRPDEGERYAARLAIANREIRGDVDTILRAHPDAVVIVASDHGPYLTGDCLYMNRQEPSQLAAAHLADRYGVLLAIRWPGGRPPPSDHIKVLQDVFFSVSAYMLQDERVWDDRIPPVTVGYGGIPDGAVRDGIISVGPDTGLPLFER